MPPQNPPYGPSQVGRSFPSCPNLSDPAVRASLPLVPHTEGRKLLTTWCSFNPNPMCTPKSGKAELNRLTVGHPNLQGPTWHVPITHLP